jgi:bifunctional NMN adenylyltransferase/nudix hydrolase
MIKQSYPNVHIRGISDWGHLILWSGEVDDVIQDAIQDEEVILYGSRDSFLPHYRGRYACQRVPEYNGFGSATVLRNYIVQKPQSSSDFRRGVVYSVMHRYDTVYQTVDIAIIRKSDNHILLGTKTRDDGKYRFIGGFVDKQDLSLEVAAQREASEEVLGIETGEYSYVGSCPIDDWRYHEGRDSIMTALFITEYIDGNPIAADDIFDAQWFPIENILDVLIETHMPLGRMLLNHFKKQKRG